MSDFLLPDWPAPDAVRALQTTRAGGVSVGAYASLNLGRHVGDDPARVRENRRCLRLAGGLPAEPAWLNQVHGARTVAVDEAPAGEADAAVARTPGAVCAVMTADCLPVLLCDDAATRVAAAHGGWRGLAAGVLETCVARLGDPAQLMAWLGPAISVDAFEVGAEVRAAFVDDDPESAAAFQPGHRRGKYRADLYQLARRRLNAAGVTRIHGGDFCTHGEPERFFSYRRDGACGRMATLIWLPGRK